MTSEADVRATDVSESRPAFAQLAWCPIFFALAVWVAFRLGAFDLWTMVTMPDGSGIRFPDGFATVDHPFHVVRAETLRRSLADGELLRWIGHHQGGYPVEFYPLGVAALEVAGWTLALGALPMIAVHKLVVIGIFLLPLAGYLLMAGFDRRSLGVAFLAGVGHLAVRGWWWSGGSMELVEWGLVTNVAAATALVIALPLTVRFIRGGECWAGGIAGALGAFALLSNPRSGFALAAVLGGAAIAAVVAGRGASEVFGAVLRRSALIIGTALMLSAPEVISLVRFNDLYYFVHYSGYSTATDYWNSSVQAVGGPFFIAGLIGFALAWLPGTRIVTRAVAATLALYVASTLLLVERAGPASLIEQLETTRLMPFQRLLWYFLAASAVEVIVIRLGSALRGRVRVLMLDGLMAVGAALVLLLYVISPPSFIPLGDRGLMPIASTSSPEIVELEEAVRTADLAAVPGTALLVLGTRGVPNSWHDQLWAPLWSERPFFYDDWLWYWQTRHVGDYDPGLEHAYRSDQSTLDHAYLAQHGIGAIVVTGDAKTRAGQEPDLTLIRAGAWDVYLVNEPASIVSFSGVAPARMSVENQRVSAGGAVTGGEILVRRNWFPRWEGTVNGVRATIRQTDGGYMAIAVPDSGSVELELRYEMSWVDWVSRVAVLAGIGLLIWMMWPHGRGIRLGASRARPVPRAIPRVRSERR